MREESAIQIKQDNKVFKLGIIFMISTLGLQFCRLVVGFIKPMPSIYLGWLFTIVNHGFFMGVLPLVLYKIMVSKKNSDLIQDFHLNAKLPMKVYVLSVVIGICLAGFGTIPAVLSNIVLSSLGYQRSLTAGTLYTPSWILFGEIIFVAVFPAVFEELVDRGLMLSIVKNYKSKSMQVFVMALMFGLAHQNAPQLIPTFVGGVFISIVVVLTKSIWPGVILHFCNNFGVVAITFIQNKILMPKNPTFIPSANQGSGIVSVLIWPAIAGVGLILLIILLAKIMRKENAPKVLEYDKDAGNYQLASGGQRYQVCGTDPQKAFESYEEYIRVATVFKYIEIDSNAAQKVKVALWEYSPLIISFGTAIFITVASFFWGRN